MTFEETQRVLAYITAAYPRYYANVSTDSARNMATVWADTLMDYSVEAVMTGVKGYISADGSGFPPAPGQIISYIHMIGHPADHSGTEAWALVRRAVNVPWDQFEASFATLPKCVQIAVGSPESLKEMAKMDLQQFETVAQSNFLRMYEAAKRREKTEDKFTGAVIGAKPNVSLELQSREALLNPGAIEQRRQMQAAIEDRNNVNYGELPPPPSNASWKAQAPQTTASRQNRPFKNKIKDEDYVDLPPRVDERLAELRRRLSAVKGS